MLRISPTEIVKISNDGIKFDNSSKIVNYAIITRIGFLSGPYSVTTDSIDHTGRASVGSQKLETTSSK